MPKEKIHLLLLLLMTVMSSCCHMPCSRMYQEQYAYLKTDLCDIQPMEESDFFLVILVDARHLDYSSNRSLLKTLVKHPSDGSKNSDVGHAWICLRGTFDGEVMEVEGGHSGERGIMQAKYFEGVMNYIDFGYANPTQDQKKCPRYEPNPIKYLWCCQRDGFFQEGAGRHKPTFAAKIDISEEQFWRILSYMDPSNYHYNEYSLTGKQCSSFVAKVASLADFDMNIHVTIPVDRMMTIGGETFTLWDDERYSEITISSPDIIEKSLVQAVKEGRAEYALDWYRRTHPRLASDEWKEGWESVKNFPKRLQRVMLFQ